jgi:predicted nucleic acid-binding Zn ribbon protein
MTGDGRKRVPSKVGDVLASVLENAGLSDRVAQAGVIPEWRRLVGPQIAAVTEPIALQQDGTLVVAVTTNGWMQELSLLEPELLRTINRDTSRPAVVRLRWTLRRA